MMHTDACSQVMLSIIHHLSAFLFILKHTAVCFNHNDTYPLFTYVLYMAHNVLEKNPKKLAQRDRIASCCVCTSVDYIFACLCMWIFHEDLKYCGILLPRQISAMLTTLSFSIQLKLTVIWQKYGLKLPALWKWQSTAAVTLTVTGWSGDDGGFEFRSKFAAFLVGGVF